MKRHLSFKIIANALKTPEGRKALLTRNGRRALAAPPMVDEVRRMRREENERRMFLPPDPLPEAIIPDTPEIRKALADAMVPPIRRHIETVGDIEI